SGGDSPICSVRDADLKKPTAPSGPDYSYMMST
ncbi:MAG: hypothetical protein ACI96W_001698, partial [Paraglaciecola sp.]